MSQPPATWSAGCDLESVIATDELNRRSSRTPNGRAESSRLLQLSRELSQNPEAFFDRLVEATKELARADSAGVSLLNEPERCFVWPSVSGGLSNYVREGTPREFGPCGTVLDRNQTMLMIHPERHFLYLKPIEPSLEEVLLIPFYVGGKAVGTIWAVSHDPDRKFDQEDRRLLESLGTFAASAYAVLLSLDLLKPFLQKKVVAPV